MTNSKPKITIVTVVYNGEQVIESTLKSVIDQDYPNFEYIVIDGKSSDKTVSIIERYRNKIDSYISEKDSGVYDAMNKGIDQATGEWILFMNAGDHFYSNKTVSDFFSSNIIEYNNYSVLYGDAEFRLKHIAYISEASDKVTSNEYMPFSHQAAFTKTSVAKTNQFDLSYRIAADTAFFLRLVIEKHNFHYVPITVCSYNALEGLSADNEIKRSKEIVALQAKWNKIDPDSSYFKKYIRNAYIKQFLRKLTPDFIWVRLRERTVLKKYKNSSQIG